MSLMGDKNTPSSDPIAAHPRWSSFKQTLKPVVAAKEDESKNQMSDIMIDATSANENENEEDMMLDDDDQMMMQLPQQ